MIDCKDYCYHGAPHSNLPQKYENENSMCSILLRVANGSICKTRGMLAECRQNVTTPSHKVWGADPKYPQLCFPRSPDNPQVGRYVSRLQLRTPYDFLSPFSSS